MEFLAGMVDRSADGNAARGCGSGVNNAGPYAVRGKQLIRELVRSQSMMRDRRAREARKEQFGDLVSTDGERRVKHPALALDPPEPEGWPVVDPEG
jgi:hypothetical protein